jgi:hypothetical protein
MVDQKIDPNRPKDDGTRFATAHYPTADPPVNEEGDVLPLGEETLEAQREAFKKAEQQQATVLTENPLDVAGVEGDVQNALQNPQASGTTATSKDDVKKQAEATKQGLNEQTEEVKQDLAEQEQQEAPKTTTETPKPSQGNAVHLSSGATTAQPRDEGSLPVKQDAPPKQLAAEEGQKVEGGDPQQQHAQEAKGKAPKAVAKKK